MSSHLPLHQNEEKRQSTSKDTTNERPVDAPMPHQTQQASNDVDDRAQSPSRHSQTDSQSDKSKSGPQGDVDETPDYKPKTLKFWVIMICNMLAMLLVALDRTILATAIPKITDEFRSLGDIGWYGSAYMITGAAFQLLFGRIYKFYDMRRIYLACILIFEIGSILCAAAPSSSVFIVGRAVAGLGSAGIWTGAMLVIIPIVPLHKRPMYQAMFGLTFGISSIVGPVLGGALTDGASWRWCFWINLPVGAVAMLCLFLFLKTPHLTREAVSFTQHIMRLDPLGTILFVPSIVCLVLALQWGGSQYAWNSWRIILLLVIFAVTMIAFAAVQVLMPATATVPLKIIKQRSMLAGFLYMTFIGGAMVMCVYYIPLWFQTTHGVSPVKSGVYILPLVISLVIANIIQSALTQRIGYYVPAMLISSVTMAVGEGLMASFTPSTGHSQWIAYQFLTGFGLGFGMQTVSLAIQATLPREDVAVGLSLGFFGQQLGGAIFVSVGQTILSTSLIDKLSGVSGLDAPGIIKAGATNLHRVVPEQFYDTVCDAYNFACTRIFYAAMALTLAQLCVSLCMEWRSIKKDKKGGKASDPEKNTSVAK